MATDTAPPCPAAPKRNAAPTSDFGSIPKSRKAFSVIASCPASVSPPTPVATPMLPVIPNARFNFGDNLV